MAGCKTHLKNQIDLKAVEEGVDALSEKEKEVYEADEDEIDDVVPDNYGPNSDEWDGDPCPFCYTMGKIGALFFGGGIFFISVAIAAVLLIFDFEMTSVLAVVGGGFVLGLIVWLYLRSKVKTKGYFPWLGPKIGPTVEKYAAENWDVYLTATAKKEYGQPITDGGTQAVQVDTGTSPEDIDEHYDEPDEILDKTPSVSIGETSEVDLLEENQRLKTQLRKQKERAEKQRKLADAKQNKFLEKNEDFQKTNQQVESLEEENEELESELEELQNTIEVYENSTEIDGIKDDGYKFKFWIPHPSRDTQVGPFYYWDTVQYDHPEFRGTTTHVLATTAKQEEIPEYTQTISDSEYPKFEDYLWPDPEKLDQPIDVADRSHQKYDEREDNPLFLGSIGQTEDAVTDAQNDVERPWTSATLTLGFDLNGNPVQEGADDSGSIRELKNEVSRLERKKRRLTQRLEDWKRDYEDLEDEKTILREDKEAFRRKWKAKQEEYRDLREEYRDVKRKLRDFRERASMAEKDKEHYREQFEQTKEQAKNIQKQHSWEDAERGREAEMAQNHENTTRSLDEIFNSIKGTSWSPDGVDLDRVGDDDYEYGRDDVLRAYLKDPQGDTDIKDMIRAHDLQTVSGAIGGR